MSQITQLLQTMEAGDPKVAAELLPLVYDELRRIAARKMASEAAGQTLQPTALVHEAWLKVAGANERIWNGRQHFVAVAAEAMRCILVDRARRRTAAKRGAGAALQDVDALDIMAPEADDQVLAVNDALVKFASVDASKAELVKLRYFVGFTFEETAELLGISVPTAKNWWAFARAWLRVEIANAARTQPAGSI